MSEVRKFLGCYITQGYFDMDFHSHDAFEINYVEKGNAIYIVGDKPILLKKNDAIIIDSKIPHKLILEEKNSKIYGSEIAKTYIGKDFFDLNRHVLIKPQALVVLTLKDLVSKYISETDDFNLQITVHYLFSLARTEISKNLVSEIQNYIVNNYKSITSLDEMAKFFHLSKVHLQRVFKAETGITIGKYIMNARLNQACYLLKHSNLPIGEIDCQIGMNSRQAFFDTFKKQYGISPSEYKKLNKD